MNAGWVLWLARLQRVPGQGACPNKRRGDREHGEHRGRDFGERVLELASDRSTAETSA
jgi:hypothetical protein